LAECVVVSTPSFCAPQKSPQSYTPTINTPKNAPQKSVHFLYASGWSIILRHPARKPLPINPLRPFSAPQKRMYILHFLFYPPISRGTNVAKIRVLVLLLRRFLGLAEGGMLPESRRILPRRGKHVAPMFLDNRRSVWIEDLFWLKIRLGLTRVRQPPDSWGRAVGNSAFDIPHSTFDFPPYPPCRYSRSGQTQTHEAALQEPTTYKRVISGQTVK